MVLKEITYRLCARLLPPTYRKHVQKQLVYAGEYAETDLYLGSATVLALLAALAVLVLPFTTVGSFKLTYIIYSILTFIGVEIMTYLLLYFKVEDRTKRVERVLPDMLQLLSSNIRVGMTPFQALKLAARKEFGPLEEEIRHATARSLGTESFAQTLLGMSKRIKSDMLERAMKLFGTAMHSGGHLAPLLEELAKDIGETQALKKELVTNTKTYSSFIMFTIVVGTPLLLAISIHFITVITGLQAQTSTATASFGLGFLGGKVAITVDFLIKVSIVMLTLTGLLAGMLLGVITEGKAKFGLKYAPIIIGGSLIAFVILRILVTRYVGTLF